MLRNVTYLSISIALPSELAGFFVQITVLISLGRTTSWRLRRSLKRYSKKPEFRLSSWLVANGKLFQIIMVGHLHPAILRKALPIVLLDITGFKGRIFADPSRQIYHGLGMNKESLALPAPDHVKKSYADNLVAVTLKSIWARHFLVVLITKAEFYLQRGPIQNPSMIGKNGNVSQLGGEFVFGPGM
jgi:hypothetical protein